MKHSTVHPSVGARLNVCSRSSLKIYLSMQWILRNLFIPIASAGRLLHWLVKGVKRGYSQICKFKVNCSEAASCIISVLLNLSLSLFIPTHLFPPPPPFVTPAMRKLSLNGCGDDAVCLHALWVMSGSPCSALNTESLSAAEWTEGRFWDLTIIQSRYNRLPPSLFHIHRLRSYLFMIRCMGVRGKVARMLGMVLTTCPWSWCWPVLPPAGCEGALHQQKGLQLWWSDISRDWSCWPQTKRFQLNYAI